MDYRFVSFTGTRLGCDGRQMAELESWLQDHRSRMEQLWHGCCVGADIQAHHAARRICGQSLYIGVYPSTANTRAPIPEDADYVHERLPPLTRNPLIVDSGPDVLLACPLTMEEGRGGTWHAVRYARNKGVPRRIFWPDGTVANDSDEEKG